MEVDEILKPYVDKATELGVDIPVLRQVYRIATVQNHLLEE